MLEYLDAVSTPKDKEDWSHPPIAVKCRGRKNGLIGQIPYAFRLTSGATIPHTAVDRHFSGCREIDKLSAQRCLNVQRLEVPLCPGSLPRMLKLSLKQLARR